MNQTEAYLASIKKSMGKNEFDKFIRSMNFPKFKSFAPDTSIQINHPVTVIVGPNGGGKSSILHAAWGMPHKHSTSRFWFSTPVDPIDFKEHDQNRYWYSHYIKELGAFVESRKICGNKRHGYWEPTRPALKEGMASMPPKDASNSAFISPSGDRWTPTERSAHYFNSKAESSAFDRFFYSTGDLYLNYKQDHFVKYSKKLKEIVDGNLTSLVYYNVERVSENFDVPSSQLDEINKILKKNYKSAKYVKHRLYDNNFSPSVIFETPSRNYSECFAGSGELAVVNLILSLDKVKEYDLVLLDEPETSLHPGAQARLLEYILSIVDKKKIQVLISTHSPTFVELLPNASLVVLDETSLGISPRVAPTKNSAFFRLGTSTGETIGILTEDKLLKALVERSIARLAKEDRVLFDVVALEVGSSEMLSNQVKAHIGAKSRVLMVLDGDQKGVEDLYIKPFSSLSPDALIQMEKDLKKLGVSIVGSRPDIEGWMRWCSERIVLLDRICPEQVLLELMNPSHPLLTVTNASNQDFKKAVKSVLKAQGDEYSTEAQYVLLKNKLGAVSKGSSIDVLLDSLKSSIQKKAAPLFC